MTDIGVKWTLCGHSERRIGYGGQGESSAQVAVKTKNAIVAGIVILIFIIIITIIVMIITIITIIARYVCIIMYW